jgi:hypothetical protein
MLLQTGTTTMRPLLHLCWLLPSLALAVACSSSDDGNGGPTTTTTTETGGTSSTTSGTGASGGSGGSDGGGSITCNYETGQGGSCQAPGFDPPTDESTVDSVSATITDLDGNPVVGLLVDVCDLSICYNGTTDADGDVAVNTQSHTFTGVRMLYGNGVGTVRLYAPLPPTALAALGEIQVARLPATGSPLVPGEDATSGDATLAVNADAFVEFDSMVYCTTGEQAFRSVSIPTDGSVNVPALDESYGFEIAVGLAPINTQICPPAQLTVPNTPGWAANAEVEFWYQGTLAFLDYAPFGDWALVSDGVVSADGQTVSTNEGEGIPELGLVAIRLKP